MLDNSEKRLLKRKDAPGELQMSLASLDIAIQRGLVKTVRKGRHVFISCKEVERLREQPLPTLWPPKQNGKTTRHFAPVAKKPPIRTALAPRRDRAVNE
jgi:hypothetical protein